MHLSPVFQFTSGCHFLPAPSRHAFRAKRTPVPCRRYSLRCVLARPSKPGAPSSTSARDGDQVSPPESNGTSHVPRDSLVKLHPFMGALNRATVTVAVAAVDKLYKGRDQYRRFYVLEVMARIPFFAYACMLHLSETLGVPSDEATQRLRDHFEQADNEAMHLAVMAMMGGGDHWLDKFLAAHLSMLYFFISIIVFFVSPAVAYNFNELIELHAYDTYDKFIRANVDFLQTESAVPLLAHEYYTSSHANPPRKIESMYDVLVAIRDDERNHSNALNRYTSDAITGAFKPNMRGLR